VKRQENGLALCVPDANYSIGATRGKTASVDAECERLDYSWMADKPIASLACPRIEDLNSIRVIRWKGRDQTAIVVQNAIVEFMELSFSARADVEDLRVG